MILNYIMENLDFSIINPQYYSLEHEKPIRMNMYMKNVEQKIFHYLFKNSFGTYIGYGWLRGSFLDTDKKSSRAYRKAQIKIVTLLMRFS